LAVKPRRVKAASVELLIEVRDGKGKVVATRRCRSDLALNNFAELINSAFFTPLETIPTGGTVEWAEMVQEDGLTRGFYTWTATGESAIVRSTGFDGGVQIAVGTGTTSPTRYDYKLEAKVKQGTPTRTATAEYTSLAVSLVLETAATVAEAGLLMQLWNHYDELVWVLLFRDIFTPIDVPAGGTISVTYRISW